MKPSTLFQLKGICEILKEQGLDARVVGSTAKDGPCKGMFYIAIGHDLKRSVWLQEIGGSGTELTLVEEGVPVVWRFSVLALAAEIHACIEEGRIGK